MSVGVGKDKLTKTKSCRQPPMEDDLKILKVEYLSNHWSDFSQILNLRSGDQTKIEIDWDKDAL